MAVTPFIRTLQSQGGTFYTFTSASEDLGMTFNNSDTKFRFTKYVLLNIPNIAVPAFLDNKVQFGAIDGALIAGLNADNNINLAESFENYCLNFEAMLVSRPEYDRTAKQNITERVFWKWLKELGAIRFADANSMQSNTNLTTDPRFVEEDEVLTGAERYERVVKYIGDIDIVNSVQNNVNAYTEVYIHVPTNDGATPLVMFKTLADDNYPEDFTLVHEPVDPLNNEVIYGRNYYDTHPAGLSINALFDQDTLTDPTSLIWNTTTLAYDIPGNWYDPKTGPNAYFTDVDFADSSNIRLQKTYGLNVVEYVRTNLDGIMVDFDPTNYKPITDNPRISTIQEYNSTVDATDFEFNAILVYYDVYDPNNPTDFATNLYGILFLENVEQISTEEGIPRFKKFIPNIVTKENGNSFGIKINLKFDTSTDNGGVEKAINDYSSFSLELFVDSMTILQQAAQTLQDQISLIQALNNRIDELETQIVNLETYDELNLRITTLENSFTENQAIFSNTDEIVGMINNISDELNNIINNQTSIEVSYNIDAVVQGDNIYVDRSIPNQVIINSTTQGANISATASYQGDLSVNTTLDLQKFNNYFRHYASGLTITATGDITLKINDGTVRWQRGQTFRLAFEDILDMGSYNFVVLTDASNAMGSGAYGVVVAAFTGAEFDDAGDRPIFDITCVDPTNMVFIYDQIR